MMNKDIIEYTPFFFHTIEAPGIESTTGRQNFGSSGII
jgi:hypothetical protein